MFKSGQLPFTQKFVEKNVILCDKLVWKVIFITALVFKAFHRMYSTKYFKKFNCFNTVTSYVESKTLFLPMTSLPVCIVYLLRKIKKNVFLKTGTV